VLATRFVSISCGTIPPSRYSVWLLSLKASRCCALIRFICNISRNTLSKANLFSSSSPQRSIRICQPTPSRGQRNKYINEWPRSTTSSLRANLAQNLQDCTALFFHKTPITREKRPDLAGCKSTPSQLRSRKTPNNYPSNPYPKQSIPELLKRRLTREMACGTLAPHAWCSYPQNLIRNLTAVQKSDTRGNTLT